MECKTITVKGKNKGASYLTWQERLFIRNDMPSHLTHLTRPPIDILNEIMRKPITKDEKIRKINFAAVEVLVKIISEQKILGSTNKGFINGTRPASCFQELPFSSINDNVQYDMEVFLNSNGHRRLRYCGVGLSFDRFYVYEKGGRPVLYEEKEKAKELLRYNQNEYWRIVSLDLKRKDPYIENFFGDGGKPIVSHYLESTIIDWTHEREWRVPDSFDFNLENDFSLNNSMCIVLYDDNTYNHFYEKIEESNNRIIDGSEYDDYEGLIDIDFDSFIPNQKTLDNFNIIILNNL